MYIFKFSIIKTLEMVIDFIIVMKLNPLSMYIEMVIDFTIVMKLHTLYWPSIPSILWDP